MKNINKIGLLLLTIITCNFYTPMANAMKSEKMRFEKELDRLNDYLETANEQKNDLISQKSDKENIDAINEIIQEKTKQIDDILWPKDKRYGKEIKEINQEIIDANGLIKKLRKKGDPKNLSAKEREEINLAEAELIDLNAQLRNIREKAFERFYRW